LESEVGLIDRNIGLKISLSSHRSTDMDVQQMLERLLAGQEQSKTDQVKAEANMERQISSLASKMDTNQA
jgi:hypothetical protein